MPYREAEALIGQRPELNLSTQNAHALLRLSLIHISPKLMSTE